MAWWPVVIAAGWAGVLAVVEWRLAARRARSPLAFREVLRVRRPPVPRPDHPARMTRGERAVYVAFQLYHFPALVLVIGTVQPQTGATTRWCLAAIIALGAALYAGPLALLG